MDTSRPSDGFFTSIEVVGPFKEFKEMENAAGVDHPYNLESIEDLYWYDGPIVSIVKSEADDRPRLDVMSDNHHEGADGERVFTEVRHQLVFDTMETLIATLHHGYAPTRQTYQYADSIVRYVSQTTQIGHPNPSHTLTTARVLFSDMPADELPGDIAPDGLPTPTTRKRKTQ